MMATVLLWLSWAIILVAAGRDIATRRIPNCTVLALAFTAFGYTLAATGLGGAASAGLHMVIALAAGMILFRLRWVGGGDAKLYAAAALGVPFDRAALLLGYTAVAGVIVWLVLLLFYRGLKKPGATGERISWTLPYALPIAIAFIMTTSGTVPTH